MPLFLLLFLFPYPMTCYGVNSQTDDECPSNCSCSLCADGTCVTIDCHGNNNTNVGMDAMTFLKKFKNITRLQVSNTYMTNLTAFDISFLQYLQTLCFVNNPFIKYLPETFMANNTHLRDIQFINSSISRLHKGVFSGLQELQSVDLSSNNIMEIDEETFLHLPKLVSVVLNNNTLSELDSWPLYLMTNSSDKVLVSIQSNKISKFTNHINWTYNCGMKPLNGEFRLDDNQITHMKDFTDGYKQYSEYTILCLFRYNMLKVYFIRNPLACDCIDYNFYRFLKFSTSSTAVNRLICHSAPDSSLIGLNVVRLPLSAFQCDIHTGCPNQCKCFQEPYNRTFHINCQNNGFVNMPGNITTLKNLTDYKYLLKFQNNNLEMLEPLEYIGSLYEANFAGNNIQVISTQTLQLLANNSRYIYLDNNRLQHLPIGIQNISFEKVKWISLHSNPWACDCESKWIISWMSKIKNKTTFPEAVHCNSPSWLYQKNIFSLTSHDFCNDPGKELSKKVASYVISVVLAIIFVFVIPITVMYVKRVWVYKKFKWHPFDWDECEGERKKYDAFISYAEEDKLWFRTLVSELENNGYKLNIHHRDFHGGQSILENIGRAIDESKRTICILSKAFVNSQMCKYEFDTALSITIQTKKSRLLLIRLEDVPEEDMPRSMYLYMTRHTFIDSNSEYFFDNLKYSMPISRMGTQQDQQTIGNQESEFSPILS